MLVKTAFKSSKKKELLKMHKVRERQKILFHTDAQINYYYYFCVCVCMQCVRTRKAQV